MHAVYTPDNGPGLAQIATTLDEFEDEFTELYMGASVFKRGMLPFYGYVYLAAYVGGETFYHYGDIDGTWIVTVKSLSELPAEIAQFFWKPVLN